MRLDVSGLTKIYPTGKRALDEVSLSLGPGVFGLLGPNGAGKSSFMEILAANLTFESGTVTLNDAKVSKTIIEFYNDVFGFNEFEMMAIDGERMVINCGTIQQFIYLHGEEAPMTCPRLDHFGFSVETLEQFDDIYDKVKAWAERDERVDLIEKKTENLHDAVEMTSFYVGFLLPMMVELQHWKFIRK